MNGAFGPLRVLARRDCVMIKTAKFGFCPSQRRRRDGLVMEASSITNSGWRGEGSTATALVGEVPVKPSQAASLSACVSAWFQRHSQSEHRSVSVRPRERRGIPRRSREERVLIDERSTIHPSQLPRSSCFLSLVRREGQQTTESCINVSQSQVTPHSLRIYRTGGLCPARQAPGMRHYKSGFAAQ